MKGLSFSRSKRKLPRVNNVTIGTHVSRIPEDPPQEDPSPPPMRSNFANAKHAERARKGVVDQIEPPTESGESPSEFAKRTSRPDYTEMLQRKARIRGIAIGVGVLLVIAVAAAVVGVISFAGSLTTRMSLGDSNAKEALTTAKEGEPYYFLFAAECFEPGRDYIGPSLLILVRVDEGEKKATLLSIPPSLQVRLADGNLRRICEAQILGGDAALVRAVSDLVDVPIAHFAKTDREGFVRLVDSLGGLTVEVAEEVDDPYAGSIYIPPGVRSLSGEEVFILCRATNYVNGEEVRTKNQGKVAIALTQRLLDTNPISLVFTLDGIAGDVKMDYSAPDFLALVNTFRGMSADDIFTALVPGYFFTSTSTGIRYFIEDDTSWEAIREAFIAGQKPEDAIAVPEEVDHGSFTITVRNGSGVTGAAQQLADLLIADGFQVVEVGNANLFVYEETLVIYDYDEYAAAAATIVNSLGAGRAIPANGHHAFETDILVVAGKDWKPLN